MKRSLALAAVLAFTLDVSGGCGPKTWAGPVCPRGYHVVQNWDWNPASATKGADCRKDKSYRVPHSRRNA